MCYDPEETRLIVMRFTQLDLRAAAVHVLFSGYISSKAKTQEQKDDNERFAVSVCTTPDGSRRAVHDSRHSGYLGYPHVTTCLLIDVLQDSRAI